MGSQDWKILENLIQQLIVKLLIVLNIYNVYYTRINRAYFESNLWISNVVVVVVRLHTAIFRFISIVLSGESLLFIVQIKWSRVLLIFWYVKENSSLS